MKKKKRLYSLVVLLVASLALSTCAPPLKSNDTSKNKNQTQNVSENKKASFVVQGQSFEEAMDKVIKRFKQVLQERKNPELVIQAQNYHSREHDKDAKWLETELYNYFENQIPEAQLLVIAEAIGGIPSKTVFIQASYEIKEQLIILRLRAIGDSIRGSVLAVMQVKFKLPQKHRRSLIAVLDLESTVLTGGQQKAFGDIFRAELNQYQLLEMVSTADLARVKSIKEESGCQGEECVAVIGKKLGVDRIMTLTYLKVEKGTYFVTANLSDLQTGTMLLSQTVEHNGDLGTLNNALKRLANKIAGEPSQRILITDVEEKTKTGNVFVSSSPTGAKILLDGEPMNRKTDTLLQNLPVGKHILTVQRNLSFASQSFEVLPDKLTRVFLSINAKQDHTRSPAGRGHGGKGRGKSGSGIQGGGGSGSGGGGRGGGRR